MELTTVWFLLIAVLWAGYFLLEGFDFGVGVLMPVLAPRKAAHSDTDRRVMINTIGPVWDGNEVWLLVAGGATFAAFPEWYASLFSGFYLALLLILAALIVRGVAFEYRGKVDSDRWRRNWDLAIFWGSAVPALLWGVAFANILQGVPLDAQHHYTGTLLTLLNPYALLGGLTTLTVFTLHGAVFLALKTRGHVRDQARRAVRYLAAPTVAIAAAFLVITGVRFGVPWTWATTAVAALALAGGVAAALRGRDGWAFTGTAVAIVATVATMFGDLWPAVLPSTIDPAYSLTVENAASTPYTLKVMTWVAVIFTPIVLAYQAWTYWVFRKRLTREAIVPPAPSGDGAPARPAKAHEPEHAVERSRA
ncbi:cytochrome d ubiquinol oxidase subunit II [Thermomonospora curvata]|uniref:Cytochrome d ubiquinol oxidase, subunit II n=1 Tax=Thermomonospora curvata (strain ATCC 19995 / DSM 43183 / JCM 3096 / KCTC 9072 / NBRC 15933 / NCIMB 10081 / Henssen B9) TaxID=471852 RepID=D1A2D3_THECD|nr:cytochrome d ubiquinol oxidase subunit II [Thermomonospora curvata]ACY95953.1 cytochrome d ubiquinol oxidase, subunit II [Thermomonospora curvata DSM 43183]